MGPPCVSAIAPEERWVSESVSVNRDEDHVVGPTRLERNFFECWRRCQLAEPSKSKARARSRTVSEVPTPGQPKSHEPHGLQDGHAAHEFPGQWKTWIKPVASCQEATRRTYKMMKITRWNAHRKCRKVLLKFQVMSDDAVVSMPRVARGSPLEEACLRSPRTRVKGTFCRAGSPAGPGVGACGACRLPGAPFRSPHRGELD